MTSQAPKILIAGAGPCGLVAAHGLLARGFSVEILEQQSSLSHAGAGIVLAKNALQALDRVGLLSQITNVATRLQVGRIENASGRLLQAINFPTTSANASEASLALPRSTLADALAHNLPPSILRWNARITKAMQTASEIRVTLADGEEIVGNYLIACDGIHSATRTSFFGKCPTRYAGYTCWRGLVSLASPDGPGVFVERWHRGLRFGSVPVSPTQTYWFATANCEPHPHDINDARSTIAGIFSDFGGNVPQILQAIQREDSAAITQRDIYDLVALPKIHEGLVVLAGDAAHAMTPNLGQGACQAIEDAVAIAQLLDEHRNDLVAGGRAYQVLRMTRAQAISRRSRQLGFVATLESPVACWLRDTIMSTLQRARGKNI